MSLALELKLLSFRCCGLEMVQNLEIIGIEVPFDCLTTSRIMCSVYPMSVHIGLYKFFILNVLELGSLEFSLLPNRVRGAMTFSCVCF